MFFFDRLNCILFFVNCHNLLPNINFFNINFLFLNYLRINLTRINRISISIQIKRFRLLLILKPLKYFLNIPFTLTFNQLQSLILRNLYNLVIFLPTHNPYYLENLLNKLDRNFDLNSRNNFIFSHREIVIFDLVTNGRMHFFVMRERSKIKLLPRNPFQNMFIINPLF